MLELTSVTKSPRLLFDRYDDRVDVPAKTIYVSSTSSKWPQHLCLATIQPRLTEILLPNTRVPSASTGQMLPPKSRTASPMPHATDHGQAMSAEWEQASPPVSPPFTPLTAPQTFMFPDRVCRLLRNLVRSHLLLSDPQTSSDHAEVLVVFDDLYAKSLFRRVEPSKSDNRLWQLFRVKAREIQVGMLRPGENRTDEGRRADTHKLYGCGEEDVVGEGACDAYSGERWAS